MITKSPVNVEKYFNNVIFTSNARSAWRMLLRTLSKNMSLKVLLPSYIGENEKEGSGVFDVVREYNILFDFYSLDESLAVDMDDFGKKIASGDITLVLIIHYFGFCRNDLSMIRHMCDSHSVVMVEDCAHHFSITSDNEIGRVGDYSFYSFHKFFATTGGGALYVNKPIVEPDVLEHCEMINFDDLLLYSKFDVGSIIQKRISNYIMYQDLLDENKYVQLLHKYESGDVPQTCAILVPCGLREELYFYMEAKEIPLVSLYYRLIGEIDRVEYPGSYNTSSSILNLPTHQDINDFDVLYIVKSINEFFETKYDK